MIAHSRELCPSPVRLSLSGVVDADELRRTLRPMREAPLPRQMVLICDDDVRIRPDAIGLLYQSFHRLLADEASGPVEVVVAGAPRGFRETLQGLVDNLSSPTSVHFVERSADATSLLDRDRLPTLSVNTVPYRCSYREGLRERLVALTAPEPADVPSSFVPDAA